MISVERPTRVRHKVLWLTVVLYLITYMDRVVIANVATEIRRDLGFSLEQMGLILGTFYVSYALFQIPGAWLGDRFGPRRTLAVIVVWWSVFTSLTAAMTSATAMIIVRFLFGMGEAGAFPVATRSLSRWMLPAERGWAQGLTHAGSRFGAVITAPIVVWLILHFGWRSAFLIFGVIGIAWAVFWLYWYRDTPADHAAVNGAEREMIANALGASKRSGHAAVPWRSILTNRTVWLLLPMYFCYAWCIAIYLNWLPTYLSNGRGYDLKAMGYNASVILGAGMLGNLFGGFVTDHWAVRSGNVRRSRRVIAILGFVTAALAMIPATLTADPLLFVVYSCIAAFGLETTVGVSWAIPLDIGGDYAGSVAAVMNTGGNIAGAISAGALGYIVTAFGWNVPFFVAAGFCLVGAILYLGIDASRPIFAGGAHGASHED